MQKFYTVGMAGHIDHGKTTLTKALTGVETDRLKEEKTRKISIEPGFAPLVQSKELQISIIDVPGHERFIRQMIAGVAGIDFVVLVIAADEGVMPQTKEHLAILTLLGVKQGMIAVTKIDQVDAEFMTFVKEDIAEAVKGTFLQHAPLYFVDSVSLNGIETFKQDLITTVKKLAKRTPYPAFRLPIDQVFTVKGHGVVVRGTVFDGSVQVGDTLTALPQAQQVRVRQIESHHDKKQVVFAGQRAALNLGGISHHKLQRGDVLVADDFYTTTKRIDVAFTPLASLKQTVKQRQKIKFYSGTAEVMGKIIFFDRNELTKHDRADELLLQIELEEAVVVTRGDRFIVRRPSPVETIGGGWIINPNAEKHRFGEATIKKLTEMKRGTPEERIHLLLEREFVLTKQQLMRQAGVAEDAFENVTPSLLAIEHDLYTNQSVVSRVAAEIRAFIARYHEQYPLRQGINKAEIISAFQAKVPVVFIYAVLARAEAEQQIQQIEESVRLTTFTPELPEKWKKRIEQMVAEWEAQGANVEKFTEIFSRHKIDPKMETDLYYFLLHTNQAYVFDEDRLISQKVVEQIKRQLYEQTAGEPFSLQIVREVTGLSRKNLIPLLELFDRLGFTVRQENERAWVKEAVE